jgi:hypothetical protein
MDGEWGCEICELATNCAGIHTAAEIFYAETDANHDYVVASADFID